MSPTTVLVVDDDAAATAERIARADERLEAVAAAGARAALDRLDERAVDCVVSGYDLPEADGLALLDRVRERHGRLPFVLFTGAGSERVASRAISAGVTDYVRRAGGPDQYARLADRVRQAVERARAETERDRRLAAVESAREGVAVLDEDRRFVYVNDAYADLYGYEPERLLDEAWGLLWPPETVGVLREEVLPAVAETGEWAGVTAGLRADGTTFPGDRAVSRTDRGDLVCSVVDASGRRERSAERDRYRTLVEALDDPVYVLDEEGRFEYVNEAFVDLVGYDHERIVGARPSLVKSDAAVRRARSQLRRLLSADGPDSTTFEVEIRTADGESVPCEDHMGVLPYEGGSFRGSAGVLRDVSERKERARALREERLFLEEGIDALDDVFYIFDDDGQILRWNERVAEVTGRTDAEISGLTPAEFVVPEHRDRIEAGLEEVFETGHAVVRADYLTADGDRVPYEFKATRLTDADGTVVGFAGVGRDVTERLAYERRLERQNERLEEFASMVSHDLRNPLNVAEGYLDLAREADGPDGDHLDAVASAHDKMGRLIEELLTLARQGDLAVDREPVALGEAVRRRWAAVNTGDATLEVSGECTLSADPARLGQLLENLVQNALDHGGAAVTVRVGALEDGFYLADDGPGIPPDERDRAFEDGYTTRDDGIGFGLSVVRRVAEAHGWSVRATESEAGGARFEVTGVELLGDGAGEAAG